MSWSLVMAAATVTFPATASAQAQDPPPPAPYVIEWHSAPMLRTSALADLSWRLVDRGSIWAVDGIFGGLFQSPTKKGFTARLAKFALFDAFIIGYTEVVAHEYGPCRQIVRARSVA